ncbi:hypothetical protein CHISP_2939 [Chitinispirillum alkaliphilum]|nr:hypothetical protein CHISP_2939 [Chitinispirillum alkaliphilum]
MIILLTESEETSSSLWPRNEGCGPISADSIKLKLCATPTKRKIKISNILPTIKFLICNDILQGCISLKLNNKRVRVGTETQVYEKVD